jgi:hypothetical protein
MLWDERMNMPLEDMEFSAIPYESEGLKELEQAVFLEFLKNYPEEEHALITERLAYIRDYNLHFAYCDDCGPALVHDHEFYYKRREHILQEIGFSEQKFYNFKLLQDQIGILGLNPRATFEFITYLYYYSLGNRKRSKITYGERIKEMLDLMDTAVTSMTIKVGRKNFIFKDGEFIKSMFTHYLDANLFSSCLAMYEEKELKRETDYRIIKTLLDYLPIKQMKKKGCYTQAERNFSLCVLYFCGSLLGDEYEVCMKNNATFDKLMRDFKRVDNYQIGI